MCDIECAIINAQPIKIHSKVTIMTEMSKKSRRIPAVEEGL